MFFDDTYLRGFLKLFRLLILKKFPTFSEDGYETFKENEPVIYCNTPATYIVAQYLCNHVISTKCSAKIRSNKSKFHK